MCSRDKVGYIPITTLDSNKKSLLIMNKKHIFLNSVRLETKL